MRIVVAAALALMLLPVLAQAKASKSLLPATEAKRVAVASASAFEKQLKENISYQGAFTQIKAHVAKTVMESINSGVRKGVEFEPFYFTEMSGRTFVRSSDNCGELCLEYRKEAIAKFFAADTASWLTANGYKVVVSPENRVTVSW